MRLERLYANNDHGDWYREMFAPSVTADFLKPAVTLGGYRNSQVYIYHSMHVPLRYEAVRNCMPVFFDLLEKEPDPTVRVVLGHFVSPNLIFVSTSVLAAISIASNF